VKIRENKCKYLQKQLAHSLYEFQILLIKGKLKEKERFATFSGI
jgi:hypothetical protein